MNYVSIRTGHFLRSIFRLGAALGVLGCTVAAAGGVTFTCGNAIGHEGDTLAVPVSVGGFTGVLDAQFTVQWDPAVMTFSGLGDFGLDGLGAGNFGTAATLTGSGRATCSWDDLSGQGVTLPDGTVAFTISFTLIGSAGTSSSLALTDTPTPRSADDADLNPLAVASVAGLVQVDNRAAPAVTTWPTASSLDYGQTNSASTLSGGAASVPGSFDFQSPGTTPRAGASIVSVIFTPTDAVTYHPVFGSVELTVAPASVSVTGLTAVNKVYDGGTTATLNLGSATLNGVLDGDVVALGTANLTASFADKTVGDGKPVTVSGLTLAAADAGNYVLTVPAPTANITARGLTVTGIAAANKTYDSGTTATLNLGSAALSGVLSGDSVTLSTIGAAGNFADKQVANGKIVTVSGLALNGPDAGNYALTPPTPTANITAIGLTVTGVTAANKVYDRGTSAPLDLSSAALSGLLTGDTVTLATTGAAGNFADKNVGNAKTVTVSGLALTGPDAGNYSFTPPSPTANITALGLTVSGLTAATKVYDGGTVAVLALANAALSGVLSGDVVTVATAGASGSFADKTVGTGKTVTVTGLALTGADAANYSFASPAPTASITALGLTVIGVTAANKAYDGGTTATLGLGSATLHGVLIGDTVTLATANAAGSFGDKTVGNGKTVTVSGLALSGTDAANYALTPPVPTANITALGLTVTGLTAANKIYDGGSVATLGLGGAALNGVLSGDIVTLTTAGATGSFPDKTVGDGKTVTVTGLSLNGADAGNYSLMSPTPTANITALGLTVTGVTAANKVYDGGTVATLGLAGAALRGVLGGDTVTLATSNASGSFVDKQVANAKIVLVSGLALSGPDAGNYSLTPPMPTANITFLGLAVSGVTAANKVYDRATAATLNLGGAALSGVLSGDSVSLVTVNATGSFADKRVGNGKTVTVSGLTLNGPDAGNYSFAPPAPTANITAVELTVTGLRIKNKSYDATTSATLDLTSAALSGVLDGDAVTLNTAAAAGAFANPASGGEKQVAITGLALAGADAANYTLIAPIAWASITGAPLIVRADDQVRVVGQTNPVWTASYSGFMGTDGPSSLAGELTFSFTDTNGVSLPGIETNTPAGAYFIVPSGLSAVNYSITYSNGTLRINDAYLTVAANSVSRPYGDANPALTVTITGFLPGDEANAYTGAPELTTAANPASPVGTYDILVNLGSMSSTRYGLRLTNGTLTVAQAPLNIIVQEASRFYGSPNPVLTGTVSGIRNNDPITVSFVSSAAPASPVGAYPIAVNFPSGDAVLANYEVNISFASLDVLPTALSVLASDATRAYGQPNPVFTGTVNGLQNGDTLSTTYACTASITSSVGTYPIVPAVNGPADVESNYQVTVANGTLRVVAAVPTLTWTNPAPITYGTALGTNQLNATADVPGAFDYRPPAGTALFTGTNLLTVVFTPADATNYNSLTVAVSLVVSPAPLTVSADNATRPYGQTNPIFSGTLTGLQNGDNITETFACAAGPASSVGAYPIVPAVASPGNLQTNYQVALLNGTLSVTSAAPVLTWTNPAPITYGTALGTNQLNATADVPGSFYYSNPPSGTVLAAGTNLLSVLFIPGDTLDYATVTSRVSVVVSPAILTVSADNATRLYGTTNPIFAGTITGRQNGDNITPVFSCAAVPASYPGSYPITVGFQDPDNRLANYTVVTQPGTLTVLAASAPVIEPIAQQPGLVVLTWQATATQSYQVQFATDLVLANWTNLGSVEVATNSTASVSDALGADPRRFYRVVLLP